MDKGIWWQNFKNNIKKSKLSEDFMIRTRQSLHRYKDGGFG